LVIYVAECDGFSVQFISNSADSVSEHLAVRNGLLRRTRRLGASE